MMADKYLMGGVLFPLSHVDSVRSVTGKRAAVLPCVRCQSSLAFLRCSLRCRDHIGGSSLLASTVKTITYVSFAGGVLRRSRLFTLYKRRHRTPFCPKLDRAGSCR